MKLIKKVEEGCIIPNGISYRKNKRLNITLWALKFPLFLTKTKYSWMADREVLHRLHFACITAQGCKFIWLEM